MTTSLASSLRIVAGTIVEALGDITRARDELAKIDGRLKRQELNLSRHWVALRDLAAGVDHATGLEVGLASSHEADEDEASITPWLHNELVHRRCSPPPDHSGYQYELEEAAHARTR